MDKIEGFTVLHTVLGKHNRSKITNKWQKGKKEAIITFLLWTIQICSNLQKWTIQFLSLFNKNGQITECGLYYHFFWSFSVSAFEKMYNDCFLIYCQVLNVLQQLNERALTLISNCFRLQSLFKTSNRRKIMGTTRD